MTLTRSFQAALAIAVTLLASMVWAGDGTAAQAGDTDAAASGTQSFAVVYRPGPAWRSGVPMEEQGLRDHFFYLRDLDRNGRIILAGPLGPDGGLLLVRARDQAEADGLVAADPAIVSGLFVGAARPFTPRFVGREPLAPVRP